MEEEFIPYSKQHISQEDIDAVSLVLKSKFITQGPYVDTFEKAISKKVKAKYAIALNSATSALHLACLALDLKEGDYLWTTPISFVASANCARYCSANVSFVDINSSTGLISINELEEKLIIAAKKNKLPKIIIPVHLGGASCDMKKIYDLSRKYNFRIIEDASHALGGLYEQEPVGSCKYSDVTVFSFHPVKMITTGEGRMVTTNDINIANKIKTLRSHGITKLEKDFIYEMPGDWYYEQQSLGFNYRITDLCCALGTSQLSRLENFIFERTNIDNKYRELLQDTSFNMIEIKSNVKSSFHLSILKLPAVDKNLHKFIFEGLKKKNIGVQLHYLPIHLQPYYREMNFKKGDYPESEAYAISSLSIPNYPGLETKHLLRIINVLKNLLDKY